ncbi:hypothetical protein FRC07_010635 [Ceratobasidium sp. 392]|nr:hypothetical protein FRC07_010635 [Ceratobasidium sp. 392]
MAAVTQSDSLQRFQSDLVESTNKMQTIIDNLLQVKEDLSHLQQEIDRTRSKQTLLQEMKAICTQGTRDTLDALNKARGLRDKLGELQGSFTGSQTSRARQLTVDIQNRSGAFFTRVESIELAIQDIKAKDQALRESKKSVSWWKKLLYRARDLLLLASAIMAFIPGGGIIGAGLGLGGVLAGAAYTGVELRQSKTYVADAVQKLSAHNVTLRNIRSFQPSLERTLDTSHSILDGYAQMQQMLANQQASYLT